MLTGSLYQSSDHGIIDPMSDSTSHPIRPARFDGRRFHNQRGAARRFGAFLHWMRTRRRGVWRRDMSLPPGPPPPERITGDALRVTFVNHATVLIQTGGMNLLTDPIWSERASPLPYAGPRRYRPPGIRFDDLPKIDLVLLSHDHYDHMDIPTLRRLCRRDNPQIFAGLRQREVLARHRLTRVSELDWWDELQSDGGLRITGVPARHWTGRALFDQGRRLWLGFVVHTGAGPVYFSGDTGMGPHFEQVHQRFGPPRLAILPIGAWLPRWFMAPVHISPDEAVEAHLLMQANMSMAVHFGTFDLADDGQNEAPEALYEARRHHGISDDIFWLPEFGEGRDIPGL